jgi:hypothetical protein
MHSWTAVHFGRTLKEFGKREARAVDPCWGALQLHFKSKNLRYKKRSNAHLPLLVRLWHVFALPKTAVH